MSAWIPMRLVRSTVIVWCALWACAGRAAVQDGTWVGSLSGGGSVSITTAFGRVTALQFQYGGPCGSGPAGGTGFAADITNDSFELAAGYCPQWQAAGTFAGFKATGTIGMSWTNDGFQCLCEGFANGSFTVFLNCALRGDTNGSGAVETSDIFYLINHIFAGGPAPPVPCRADANRSGAVDVADIFYVINFLFAGGPAPPAS